MATAPPIAAVPPPEEGESFLVRFARALLERHRQKLGIPEQERQEALAESENLLKRAQAAYYLGYGRQSGRAAAPPAVGSFEDYVLRKGATTPEQIAAARAEWAAAGQPPERKPRATSPHYVTNERGEVTAIVPQPDGTFKQVTLGGIGQRPADVRPNADGSGSGGDGGGGVSEGAAMLLQGGTADKLPIKERAAAVAAARASGGVDGTGFVPMNSQQQFKFSDFRDLRAKALRLRALLADQNVASKLGPLSGRLVGMTKEWPGVGQPTTVKEAFDLFKDLSDAELRKRSGAAISPGEYTRIVGFTVDPTKQPDSNLTNLNRMIATLDGMLRTIGASNLGGAPSVPAGGLDPAVQHVLDAARKRGGGGQP